MTTTKSKLMYRIFLFDRATELCKQLALMAAESNGSAGIHFDLMVMSAKAVKNLDEQYMDNITVEVSEEDKWFCIDMKYPEWERYQTVLRIEQVEIDELLVPEEEDVSSLENLSQMGAQC